ASAKENDHDRRYPVLFNHEPQQEKNEKNSQRKQHVGPGVAKDRTERGAHAQKALHRGRSGLRRQASKERKNNVVHGLEGSQQDTISGTNQNVPAYERIPNLPADQARPADQGMRIAAANKWLETKIELPRSAYLDQLGAPDQREDSGSARRPGHFDWYRLWCLAGSLRVRGQHCSSALWRLAAAARNGLDGEPSGRAPHARFDLSLHLGLRAVFFGSFFHSFPAEARG